MHTIHCIYIHTIHYKALVYIACTVSRHSARLYCHCRYTATILPLPGLYCRYSATILRLYYHGLDHPGVASGCQELLPMHSTVPNCTQMYPNVPKCTQMYTNVPKCMKMCPTKLYCTQLYFTALY